MMRGENLTFFFVQLKRLKKVLFRQTEICFPFGAQFLSDIFCSSAVKPVNNICY